MKCEEVSKRKVTMLAVDVFHEGNGLLMTKPRKVPLDGPFLSCTSAHDDRVHRSWPLALLESKMRLSSVELRHEVGYALLERFRGHHASESILSRLEGALNALASNGWLVRRREKSPEEQPTSWLVLPGHPAVRFGALIGKSIKSLCDDPLYRGAWSGAWKIPPRIRLAWKNCLPPVGVRLRKLGECASLGSRF